MRVTRKAITAKEAKIERESFEAIFGKDAECYEHPIKSPEKVRNTPAPTPDVSDDEDSIPSPAIELEDREEGELVISLPTEMKLIEVKLK